MNEATKTLETLPLGMLRLPECMVGFDKSRQVTRPDGTASGGEIYADMVVLSTQVHSFFDEGTVIVWNIQGIAQPIRQRRTKDNVERVRRLAAAAADLLQLPAPITLTPDATGVAGKIDR